MTRAFGDLLRQVRSTAGMTLGDLADRMEVSVAYISSVERGVKSPLSEDRIRQVAEAAMISPDGLLAAAAESRGAFLLDTGHQSPVAREVGAALMRGWPDLSDVQLRAIGKIVEGRPKR
jgi:transcriptional regulator with XRE-family HTH domain